MKADIFGSEIRNPDTSHTTEGNLSNVGKVDVNYQWFQDTVIPSQLVKTASC